MIKHEKITKHANVIKHTPVLLKESLRYLAPRAGQVLVDATVGQGGHAQAILKEMERSSGRRAGLKKSLLIGLDRDTQALDKTMHRLSGHINRGKLLLEQAKFSRLTNVLQEIGHTQVDGILMDLGVSSNQILSKSRGFSFAHPESPLDMRMDQREDLTAARVLAEWSEQELRDLFFLAGEKRYAKSLARTIIKERKHNKIESVGELLTLTKKIMRPRAGKSRRNIATKIFMALRIAVNHELQELEQGLESALIALKPGGRLVVITFNSLEDKNVKQKFREWATTCICPPELPVCRCNHEPLVKILTTKPVAPRMSEIKNNPRARSAKLRAVKKL